MEKIASLMVLAAAALWGSSGLFITQIGRFGLSGSEMTAIRLCAVSIMVFAFLFFTDRNKLRVRKADWGWMVFNGIIGIFVFNLCYTYAIQWTGMATAAVLIYLMPSMVMLYSVIFLKEKFTARKGLCLLLSLMGCALVSGVDSGFSINAAGLIMGVIAAFCYAEYNILVATRLKAYSSITNILYPFTFAAIAAMISEAMRGKLSEMAVVVSEHPESLVMCALLGLCCSILAYWLYNTAVKTISASKASILATFEPVAAALLGLFFLHQRLSFYAVLGIGCELVALILLNIPEKISKEKV